MKKVLYLHTGAELYGADKILLTILENLDRQKYEPLVILPCDGPLCEKIKELNIRVLVIKYPIIRRKYFTLTGIVSYFFEFFSSLKVFKKLLKDEHIDIIHNNTIAVLEGMMIKKITGAKLITHVHEMIENPKFVSKFLYKYHIKYSDKIIAVSFSVKNHIEKLCKLESSKIIVIHNGIKQIDVDKVANSKEKYGFSPESFVVAIIGRINAIKGQEHFVDAIKKICENNINIYGLIVGDAFEGQEWRMENLKEYIKKQNLEEKIKIVGFKSNIAEVYKFIDCLVLCSIQNDSFPTVVLEAMSCGIPTVAYKCGGVEEMIVEGENGYLVEQGDVLELSNKLDLVYKKKMNSNLFFANSKLIFFEKFSENIFIRNIMNAYESGVNDE